MSELGIEKRLGRLALCVEAIQDPFPSNERNGHCSEAYLRGEERLIAVQLRVAHGGGGEPLKVGAQKVHLFDDASFVHEDLGLDSRNKAPRLVESFLLPGSSVRGWVTFALSWERHARRIQVFSSYLGEAVVAFDLGPVDPRTLLQKRAYAERQAAEPAAQGDLTQRADEVAELERRAAVARLLLEQRSTLEALEERSLRAMAAIEEASTVLGKLDDARRVLRASDRFAPSSASLEDDDDDDDDDE